MRISTVGELKEYLEDKNDEARVFIIFQESWPFEADLEGAITREELTEASAEEEYPDDEDEEGAYPGEAEHELEKEREIYRNHPYKDRWGAPDEYLPQDEVILVMGSQERYGSKEAWNIV